MEYSELISKVFDSFYENDKGFPQDMLYPIMRYDFSGNIVDMFIICNLTRNTTNGRVEKIDKIEEIFFSGIETEKSEFVFIDNNSIDFKIDFPKSSKNVSVKEFTSLYMKTREFVFNDKLSYEQIETLKSLIAIYEDLFEEEVKTIYHKYGYDFYKWAYKVISEEK